MGWLIAAFILIGLAMIPLHLICIYNQYGFLAYLRIAFLKFKLYPGAAKKKKANAASPEKTEAKQEKAKSDDLETSKSGGNLKDFAPFLRVVFSFLNELRKRLVVKNLELKVILAGGDPCNLAVNYGKSWAALGNLMPHLEKFLDIRKRDLQIECDFNGLEPTVYFFTDIKISFGRMLWLIVCYGIKAIKVFFIMKNTRKGGAQV